MTRKLHQFHSLRAILAFALNLFGTSAAMAASSDLMSADGTISIGQGDQDTGLFDLLYSFVNYYYMALIPISIVVIGWTFWSKFREQRDYGALATVMIAIGGFFAAPKIVFFVYSVMQN